MGVLKSVGEEGVVAVANAWARSTILRVEIIAEIAFVMLRSRRKSADVIALVGRVSSADLVNEADETTLVASSSV